MDLALIRGSALRTYELPNYELDGVRTVAFGSRSTADVKHSPAVEVRALPSAGDILARLSPRVVGGIEYFTGSVEYLVGLERALDGFDIASTTEIGTPVTAQALDARAARRCTRVVASVMENIPFYPAHNRVVVRRCKRAAREVDHFLAVTERAALHLGSFGVPEERISVVPVGIDMDLFSPATGPRADGPLRVITVSRLVPAKGVEDLVIAVGLLAQRGVEVELTIVGSGPLRAQLEAIARAMRIDSQVAFESGVEWDRLPPVYRAHDLFVLPSVPHRHWREQFGFAVIEAMGCGLAVLVGDSGSLPEVVGSDERLVRPHDPLQLAERIEALAGDEARLRVEGEASRERALGLFDVRKVREQIRSVYERVL